MEEKTAVAFFVLVAVVGVGGLVTIYSSGSTSLVPADQPVNSFVVIKDCALLDPDYRNCANPNGGCVPGYPLYKQYSFNVEGILTCCCVPHGSSYKRYRWGDSLYR